MEPISVLVVSADPLARSGLAALVAARPELALAGEAGPREAARVADARAPQAVLWDFGAARPGAAPTSHSPFDSAAAARPLRAGGAPVVALVADRAQAGEALRAGARGVLARGVTPERLGRAVAAAVLGLLVLDPELAGVFLRAPEPAGASEPLTPREREVLALVAEGLGNKAIGARLGISEHTAKFHVNAILAKLGVDSRAEAIVRAVRMGLVAL